jgi:hypothetical protein
MVEVKKKDGFPPLKENYGESVAFAPLLRTKLFSFRGGERKVYSTAKRFRTAVYEDTNNYLYITSGPSGSCVLSMPRDVPLSFTSEVSGDPDNKRWRTARNGVNEANGRKAIPGMPC